MSLAADNVSLRPGAYSLLETLEQMETSFNNVEASSILKKLEKLSVTGRDDFDPYFASEVATLREVFNPSQVFDSVKSVRNSCTPQTFQLMS